MFPEGEKKERAKRKRKQKGHLLTLNVEKLSPREKKKGKHVAPDNVTTNRLKHLVRCY